MLPRILVGSCTSSRFGRKALSTSFDQARILPTQRRYASLIPMVVDSTPRGETERAFVL